MAPEPDTLAYLTRQEGTQISWDFFGNIPVTRFKLFPTALFSQKQEAEKQIISLLSLPGVAGEQGVGVADTYHETARKWAGSRVTSEFRLKELIMDPENSLIFLFYKLLTSS